MIETNFAILIALLIWKAPPWPLAGPFFMGKGCGRSPMLVAANAIAGLTT